MNREGIWIMVAALVIVGFAVAATAYLEVKKLDLEATRIAAEHQSIECMPDPVPQTYYYNAEPQYAF